MLRPICTVGQKSGWWFHFLIWSIWRHFVLSPILAVIGIVIMRWDTLAAFYDRLDASG